MRTRPLLCLFLGLCLIAAANGRKKSRMVGSRNAEDGRFKYHVSLQYLTPDRCAVNFCGGTLISGVYVVTAAHCVTRGPNREFTRHAIVAVAGTTNLEDKENAYYQPVQKMWIPSAYQRGQLDHDIAVLKLAQRFQLKLDGSRLGRAQLAERYSYPPGQTFHATMMGFGVSKQKRRPGQVESLPASPYLKWAPALGNSVAEGSEPCSLVQVCVQGTDHIDQGHLQGPCHMDDGSPLVDESTEPHTLIGVASSYSGPVCGKYARYTRVSAHAEFLDNFRDSGTNGDIVSTSVTVSPLNFSDFPLCQ